MARKKWSKAVPPLAKGCRAIEGGDRGLEVAGAILNGPQGIPVGAALGMRLGRLDGKRKGASRVSHGWVWRGHQEPGQIVGAVTPLLAMRRTDRADRRRSVSRSRACEPGGLCLGEPPLIFQGASQGPVLSHQPFPGVGGPSGGLDSRPGAGRDDIDQPTSRDDINHVEHRR